MVTFPYTNTDFAFTLDDKYLELSTVLDDTYFYVNMTINYFPYGSNTYISKSSIHKIVLYNKQAKMHVGSIIHRYIAAIEGVDQNGLLHKTTTVHFEVREQNLSDDTLVETVTLANVKFIAGYTPAIIENNIAVLTLNKHFERITPNAYYHAQFLAPTGSHTIDVLINGSLDTQQQFTATDEDNIYSYKLDASNLTLTEGDEIELKINGTNVSKKLIVDYNRKNSNVLHYLDDYKQISTIELTGEYSLPIKYKRITQQYRRGLVEHNTIIKTDKTTSLKISPGFLFDSDFISVDVIHRNKKAWLKMNDVFVLMAPSSKKATAFNSEKDYQEYPLEFVINPTTNAQNHTF